MCVVVSQSIFTSSAVFWRARRASPNTNNEQTCSEIVHTKTSNKLFIIQLLQFLCTSSKAGKVKQWFVTGLAQCPRRIGSWDVNLSLKGFKTIQDWLLFSIVISNATHLKLLQVPKCFSINEQWWIIYRQ